MTKLKIGERAPAFQLNDLEGQMASLEDLRGQLVLVNFWSAECPWAQRADEVLKDWQDKVTLLCIASNANEDSELLSRVARERNLKYVLQDDQHEVADLYGAETTPHCFLIDSDGVLRYQGAFDDTSFRRRTPTRFYVLEAIEELRAGEPVEITETQSYGCTIVRFTEEE